MVCRALAIYLVVGLAGGCGLPRATASEWDREDIQKLTSFVDEQLDCIWNVAKVAPPKQASPEVYWRRVNLDVAGRIPSMDSARTNSQYESASQAEDALRELIQSGAAARYWGSLLRRLWFPQTDVPPYQYLQADTESWLTEQLFNHRCINEMAHELLTVQYEVQHEVQHEKVAGSSPWATRQTAVPDVFIASNEFQSARMASNATRSFLGIDLECAQCHDHPFDRWTQQQFWQTAAFFELPDNPSLEFAEVGSLKVLIPDSQKIVTAQLFVDATLNRRVYSPSQGESGRTLFADWMCDKRNRWMARHTVDVVWGQLFGVRLSELAHRAESEVVQHWERLHAGLADEFVARGSPLFPLVAALVQTRAYRAESQGIGLAGGVLKRRQQLLAVYNIKALSATQLLDSLQMAQGETTGLAAGPAGIRERTRRAFSESQQVGVEGDQARSVTQLLSLMNGTAWGQPPAIEALATADFLSEAACMDALYWLALGRPPTLQELDQFREAGLFSEDRSSRWERYEDVHWILTNSVEFNTNH
ncbi:DUF1549 domain-containing protein [Aureliella helgolandensis]|nr:DUF1549 domain-containing protein [Aureliella helgolandensis]